jgi:hypothetical protein
MYVYSNAAAPRIPSNGQLSVILVRENHKRGNRLVPDNRRRWSTFLQRHDKPDKHSRSGLKVTLPFAEFTLQHGVATIPTL